MVIQSENLSGSHAVRGGARVVDGCATEWMAGVEVPSESFRWKLASRPELVEKVVMALKDRAEASGVCEEDRITGLVISRVGRKLDHECDGAWESRRSIPGVAQSDRWGVWTDARTTLRRTRSFAEREIQIDVMWGWEEMYAWTISDGGQGFDVERLLARSWRWSGNPRRRWRAERGGSC